MEIPKAVFSSNYSLLSCVVGSDLFIVEGKTTANESALRSKRKENKVKVSFTYKRKRQKRVCEIYYGFQNLWNDPWTPISDRPAGR